MQWLQWLQRPLSIRVRYSLESIVGGCGHMWLQTLQKLSSGRGYPTRIVAARVASLSSRQQQPNARAVPEILHKVWIVAAGTLSPLLLKHVSPSRPSILKNQCFP
jgi:hypothetical protein